MKIPRCYHPAGFGPVTRSELHVFCDASSHALGYVIYLRQFNFENDSVVSFVFGSSRITPKAANIIPRIELCAVVTAAQAPRSIKTELDLKIEDTVYFSDSMIVLGYLSNKKLKFSRKITLQKSDLPRHGSINPLTKTQRIWPRVHLLPHN